MPLPPQNETPQLIALTSIVSLADLHTQILGVLGTKNILTSITLTTYEDSGNIHWEVLFAIVTKT